MIRLVLLLSVFFIYGTQFCLAQRIAFGSCSRHNQENQLWDEVVAQKPECWVWMGDNIYADTQDMSKMAAMYDQQKNRSSYQKLRDWSAIYGVWDDHDYGINDGGKYFSKKRESKDQLLRFLDVPDDAEVRKHEGVYQSYVLGQEKKTIKLILLDTRYFRDTLMASKTKGKRYEINPDGDILGDEQWKWLKNELKTSTSAVNIIVTSIQFISNEHGYEKWGNFPKARQRMLDLLAEVQPSFTFFISGDRHIAEVSKMNVPGLKYPIYDVTSSGLTHTWTVVGEEPNQYRVSPILVERNFGLMDAVWKKNKPSIQIRIIGPQNKVLYSQMLK